jgi:hypothetical protein
MAQIRISSDIETGNLILNYSDLKDINYIDFNLLEKGLPNVFVKENIEDLKNEVEIIIDALFANRKPVEKIIKMVAENGKTYTAKRTTTTVTYKGIVTEIDLRSNNDFHICALVDIYDMAISCIRMNGTLTISPITN